MTTIINLVLILAGLIWLYVMSEIKLSKKLKRESVSQPMLNRLLRTLNFILFVIAIPYGLFSFMTGMVACTQSHFFTYQLNMFVLIAYYISAIMFVLLSFKLDANRQFKYSKIILIVPFILVLISALLMILRWC